MGGWHLGVRSDTEATDRVVRRFLGPHLVEGVEAPANYSIRLGGGGARGKGAPTQLLFRSWTPVSRSRSAARVLRSLLGMLEGHLPDDGRCLKVEAQAAVSAEGWAALVPLHPDMSPEQYERRLAGAGLRFLDRPEARIDTSTGRLVVSDPVLAFDEAALGEAAAADPAPPPRPVTPGTYPLRAWVLPGPAEGLGDLGRATALAAAIALVGNRDTVGGQATLTALAAALRAARCLPRPDGGLAPLTMLLRQVAGR